MTKNGQNKTQYSFDKLRFRVFFEKRREKKIDIAVKKQTETGHQFDFLIDDE